MRAMSVERMIEAARRSEDCRGVEGTRTLPQRLAAEIIRTARLAAAMHLSGQAGAVASADQAAGLRRCAAAAEATA
jgi:hypothetical protein